MTTVSVVLIVSLVFLLPNLQHRYVADFTAGVDPRCPVHEQQMRRALVRIRYGGPGFLTLLDVEQEAWRAWRADFPHSIATESGGCMQGSRARAWTWHCAGCLSARDTYARQHPAAVDTRVWRALFG